MTHGVTGEEAALRGWIGVRYVLVHGEVLLAHHELQVVDDHVVDVVHVDGVLHGVQHRPEGGAVHKVTRSQGFMPTHQESGIDIASSSTFQQ